MSHHHSKIKTLDLLSRLLLNHYPHQYSCSHYKCRYHQQRTTQINTITKYKRISRRVSGSRHHTKTLERNVRKEVFKLNTNE